MSLALYETIVKSLVRDDAAVITDTEFGRAIEAARLRYSKDRPDIAIEDITAPGGHYFDLPSGWDDGFSVLQSLECPIGAHPPSMIGVGSYCLYALPEGMVISNSYAVAQGANIRVTYTIKHQLDETKVTIPEQDREPVCCLAAASLCDQLSSNYSNDSQSTIQADSVDHATKAGEFAKRAKVLRKRYLDELGIDAKKNVAASAVVSLATAANTRPGLTHRRNRR